MFQNGATNFCASSPAMLFSTPHPKLNGIKAQVTTTKSGDCPCKQVHDFYSDKVLEKSGRVDKDILGKVGS